MSDLFCVSHYGWYNGYDHFEGYVGDGVTSPSQELVGVYDTKKQAEKGLKAAEAEDERDKPGQSSQSDHRHVLVAQLSGDLHPGQSGPPRMPAGTVP